MMGDSRWVKSWVGVRSRTVRSDVSVRADFICDSNNYVSSKKKCLSFILN